ncbi:hypothetical protein CIHG_09204 [Coccidioides immitis H538.4]|uniref:Uncharacterized protein n=1 Tax=Coccidioides immitis H538.4 TaxID=396776 RepID=A0A0J8S2D9_COCIT|nr:hypothetical protein CIHG_09204 [Coccidioides immitis H538.4]
MKELAVKSCRLSPPTFKTGGAVRSESGGELEKTRGFVSQPCEIRGKQRSMICHKPWGALCKSQKIPIREVLSKSDRNLKKEQSPCDLDSRKFLLGSSGRERGKSRIAFCFSGAENDPGIRNDSPIPCVSKPTWSRFSFLFCRAFGDLKPRSSEFLASPEAGVGWP